MNMWAQLELESKHIFDEARRAQAKLVGDWIAERDDLRRKKYRAVLLAEDGSPPVSANPRVPQPELDQWIERPICYEVMWTFAGNDFTDLDEMGQRFMILLAAEALYGPNHDAKMLALAVLYGLEDEV